MIPERVFVALGSNVGDRAAHLAHARERLAALAGTHLAAASRVEETAPLGPVSQGPYLNQMVLLDGRERRERWGPRTLDLDIVRFGARVVHEPGLTIPHPELSRRDFWLREIAELEAPAVSHG